VKGREDANKLYQGLYKNINNFTHFHSSDLSRCVDTLNLCSGFSVKQPVITR
jgi:broad specificity phosphatase PhoE